MGHPLVVRAAATAREALEGDEAVAAVEILLGCLTAIARELGDRPASQLAWNPRAGDADHQRRAASMVHEVFGFHGVRRRPRHVRGNQYLLRPKKLPS